VPWWAVLIEGIAAIILGLLLLANPLTTTVILIQFLGIYWLVVGVVDIVRIFVDRTAWGWKLFTGIIGIIAGLLIIQYPLWATLLVPATLVWVFGFLGIVLGVIYLIQAFQGAGWGAGILGVLSILFGILLLMNTFAAALSLPFIIGILAIVGGVLALFGAFRLRGLEKSMAEKARAAAQPVASRAGTTVSGAAEAAAGVAEAGVSSVSAAGAGVVGAAATGVAAAGAVAAGAGEKMAETVPDTASEVKAEVAEAVSDVAEKASEAGEAVVEAGAAAVDKILEFLGLSDPDDLKKFQQGLEYVEGIGPVFAEKLRGTGVATLLDLLERGATPKGRDELAEGSGIGGSQILKWVNHVDLYRVKGVGSEYADLLEASGVDTVVELAQRNPANLAEKIVAVNEEKNLVRRIPVQSQVEEWVDQAKKLPRVISY
jgi:uncharacterized membrane protein HdeD (DUF308 family)/predicted flap endonuclease-1-like 5' DNA nuclease